MHEYNAQQITMLFSTRHYTCIYAPTLKKEGHIALHMSVGRSVRPSVRLSVGRYVGLP